jgi:hypothetical protein
MNTDKNHTEMAGSAKTRPSAVREWSMEDGGRKKTGAGGYGFWARMIAWCSKAALKRPQSRRSALAGPRVVIGRRVGGGKAAWLPPGGRAEQARFSIKVYIRYCLLSAGAGEWWKKARNENDA